MIDIQDYVRNNYQTSLSVPELAELFGYNCNYLSTAYKKVTGISLVHYINQIRVDAAKLLLLHTNDSIKSIAAQVGCGDSKYFHRIFRSFEQITPGMFRKVYLWEYINKR